MSMTRDFSFVIVGGGILGSALATTAAALGFEPLVLRRPDAGSPNADTLRNQGWLQSGVMYDMKYFAGDEAYATFAARTYAAGRQLLKMCGLTPPSTGGLLGVSGAYHLEQLDRKRQLLKLSEHEFARLEAGEARRLMGGHHEEGKTYYRIPDGPFDEAAVLTALRAQAEAEGAVFVEVDEPVRLERTGDAVTVHFADQQILSGTVVVTAGAGSFDLMKQCGVQLQGGLQRTPLVVGEAPDDMPAPIVVDLARGFSAVRHERSGAAAAVVMGTRAKTRDAPDPPERRISIEDQQKFLEGVPPTFQPAVGRGRYTAGYEVIPNNGISAYEPWIHPDGAVIFASPGRATISVQAALQLMATVRPRLTGPGSRRTTRVDLSACQHWRCPINMHYTMSYSYNDAEA